jgi:hypothetical protein
MFYTLGTYPNKAAKIQQIFKYKHIFEKGNFVVHPKIMCDLKFSVTFAPNFF